MNTQPISSSDPSDATVELALLGFLRQRPMHGYELHQLLADPDGLDGLWQIKLGRLYAMLGRLEADGYLVARTEPQGDRPPRKVFSLTAEGERAFLAWLETPVAQPRSLRLAFLLKLYFARREPPGTAARLIAAQQAGCEEWLVGPLVAGPATTPHQAAVRRFRLGQIEAIHNWLTWLAAAVEAGR